MAPAIRAPGVQIAVPAARFGCLADDRMLRLPSVQLYRVSVANLRRQGHHLHPTSLAGGGRNHAVADDRGREGTARGRVILMTAGFHARHESVPRASKNTAAIL